MGAQQHNENRRIAGSGRWMGGGAGYRFVSIRNIYRPKPVLPVTDRDRPNLPAGKSKSVTVTQQIPSLVLQI